MRHSQVVAAAGLESRWRIGALRLSERITVSYFLYTATVATLHQVGMVRVAAAWLIPAAIWLLATLVARTGQLWADVARDWAPLSLILVAYWQVDWFHPPPLTRWEQTWAGWDHALLFGAGLRNGIESLGGLIPGALEFTYLCLYAMPPLALAAIYVGHRRRYADRFLSTLFLGSLLAYGLLPYFPTIPPRIAFPYADMPHYGGMWRTVNVWLQDHYDISTSVFPSGHVAVAFSAAFGLLRALPRRYGVCAIAFSAASIVFVATIYCRYHYAVDALAGLLVSVAAWRVSEVIGADA